MILQRHQSLTTEHGGVTANNVMRHLRSVYNFTLARYDVLPPNPVLVLSKTRSWNREHRRRGLIAPHQLPAWWQAVMAEQHCSPACGAPSFFRSNGSTLI